MRIRLLVALAIVAVVLLFVPPVKTSKAAADCDTVNKVCDDIWTMVYDICITSGHRTAAQCAEMEAIGKIQCKIENGCPPPPIGN